jgi:hypothetical protein
VDYELIKPDKDDAYDPAPFLNYARARRTDKEERDPNVGDIVHFWDDHRARCLAAIVTVDDLTTVSLTLFMPPGEEWGADRAVRAKHDEGKGDINTFHWPCGGQ